MPNFIGGAGSLQEPVSDLVSLIYRENRGNSMETGPFAVERFSDLPRKIRSLRDDFPARRNREFVFRHQ